MAIVDLHLHTTYSDGRLSPTELVSLLVERGIKVAAITDHDSTEGLIEAFEAKAGFPDLTLIPGVELSAEAPGTEIHILGYFIDWTSQEFQNVLGQFRKDRIDRGKTIVDKLAELGMPVDWDRVLELSDGGAVGRPHIAWALIEKGHVTNFKQAFDLYLGRGGPAYAGRNRLSPMNAVSLIRNVGGVAVLAHPTWVKDLPSHLGKLKESGLAGMEVYYGGYSRERVKELKKIADSFGLIPCGGSDYHAKDTDGESFPGDQGPPIESVDMLMALAGNESNS